MTRITFRLDNDKVDEVDALAENGPFKNRSEVLREAADDFLEKHSSSSTLTDGGQIESHVLEILHDGRVEAPQRYVDYSGQVIVRTQAATMQRWKKSGHNPRLTRPRGEPAFLVHQKYLEGGDKPMNEHLGDQEIEVYYVEDSETVTYEVADGD